MQVKMQRSYKSKNGNVVFVYEVSGSKSELEAYSEAQGEFLKTSDETGKPLWFTTRCIGQTGKLIITTNGNVVPDMSEFDQAASLAAQYGGNLGTELARISAQKLLGGNRNADDVPTTPATPSDAKPSAQQPNDPDLD